MDTKNFVMQLTQDLQEKDRKFDSKKQEYDDEITDLNDKNETQTRYIKDLERRRTAAKMEIEDLNQKIDRQKVRINVLMNSGNPVTMGSPIKDS